ncbi:hypothetical protein AXW67_35050 [Bradyrhizobium neotropicale]|uniref:DUF1254 domain-containing protein n=1 Tax=Bradyrhizobium neotropicale TaxID=1497615 RepID=A0A176ZJE2_9BRAD|nr:hypothetical protein AXW67_35050 [Bradyrhizobium neotropicale]
MTATTVVAETARYSDLPSSEELTSRNIQRGAVEAVVWGMPAVNFELMLQAAIANGGAANQMLYWSRPVNWKDQALTPNPSTIYFNPFYDTTKGPVVLEIPPVEGDSSITGSIDDAWQCALEDVGPAGVDQGKGGKYLITPPGYNETPPGGYIVVPSDTFQGFAILRSNFKSGSDADIAGAVAYGKRMKIYPLSGNANQTVYVDVYDKMFEATIPYDVRFFESLNRFVQAEPWLTRDKVMIDSLKTVGIAKGKPFTADAKTRSTLDEAARVAGASIDKWYERGFSPPFFEGTHWALPVPKETIEGLSTMFADPNNYPIEGRAVYFSVAYFSAKHLGAGQFYLLAIDDKSGQPFDGKKTYRLHVPPNAPVKLYWSATAYDRKTHALIRETSRSSRASNSAGMQQNADGSLDVFVGARTPAGMESNWVPTNGHDFEILFRLYGPEKAFFDKTWILPDVEEMK